MRRPNTSNEKMGSKDSEKQFLLSKINLFIEYKTNNYVTPIYKS